VERELRGYCRLHGLGLVSFVLETDPHIRRSLEDRVMGKGLMQHLRKGAADEILVARAEHVFSSATNAVSSLERWLDEGIGFRCADFFDGAPLLLSPEVGLLETEALIRGLAALQRSIDHEQTRARMASRKASGAWSGRPPFGFSLEDGMLVESKDRIERIQRMKSLHRHGRSYRQIAHEFRISVATAHRLVKTDLRKLRGIGPGNDRPFVDYHPPPPSDRNRPQDDAGSAGSGGLPRS